MQQFSEPPLRLLWRIFLCSLSRSSVFLFSLGRSSVFLCSRSRSSIFLLSLSGSSIFLCRRSRSSIFLCRRSWSSISLSRRSRSSIFLYFGSSFWSILLGTSGLASLTDLGNDTSDFLFDVYTVTLFNTFWFWWSIRFVAIRCRWRCLVVAGWR